MRIGVCGGIERIRGIAENNLDYLEGRFKWIGTCSDAEFEEFKAELNKYSVKCEVANNFLPGDMRITGENVDYDAISTFLKKGFERANELGIKMLVLGSGGARCVPEGYPYAKAVQDIIYLVKNYISPMAAKYGIDFVFEPLCYHETNIINTVKEGAMIAAAINCDNVGTLGDIYHMYVEGDTYDDIRDLKGILRHAHISNPVPTSPDMKRCYMSDINEYDYKGFFEALNDIGCERISIEADTKDYYADIPEAAKIMKILNNFGG